MIEQYLKLQTEIITLFDDNANWTRKNQYNTIKQIQEKFNELAPTDERSEEASQPGINSKSLLRGNHHFLYRLACVKKTENLTREKLLAKLFKQAVQLHPLDFGNHEDNKDNFIHKLVTNTHEMTSLLFALEKHADKLLQMIQRKGERGKNVLELLLEQEAAATSAPNKKTIQRNIGVLLCIDPEGESLISDAEKLFQSYKVLATETEALLSYPAVASSSATIARKALFKALARSYHPSSYANEPDHHYIAALIGVMDESEEVRDLALTILNKHGITPEKTAVSFIYCLNQKQNTLNNIRLTYPKILDKLSELTHINKELFYRHYVDQIRGDITNLCNKAQAFSYEERKTLERLLGELLQMPAEQGICATDSHGKTIIEAIIEKYNKHPDCSLSMIKLVVKSAASKKTQESTKKELRIIMLHELRNPSSGNEYPSEVFRNLGFTIESFMTAVEGAHAERVPNSYIASLYSLAKKMNNVLLTVGMSEHAFLNECVKFATQKSEAGIKARIEALSLPQAIATSVAAQIHPNVAGASTRPENGSTTALGETTDPAELRDHIISQMSWAAGVGNAINLKFLSTLLTKLLKYPPKMGINSSQPNGETVVSAILKIYQKKPYATEPLMLTILTNPQCAFIDEDAKKTLRIIYLNNFRNTPIDNKVFVNLGFNPKTLMEAFAKFQEKYAYKGLRELIKKQVEKMRHVLLPNDEPITFYKACEKFATEELKDTIASLVKKEEARIRKATPQNSSGTTAILPQLPAGTGPSTPPVAQAEPARANDIEFNANSFRADNEFFLAFSSTAMKLIWNLDAKIACCNTIEADEKRFLAGSRAIVMAIYSLLPEHLENTCALCAAATLLMEYRADSATLLPAKAYLETLHMLQGNLTRLYGEVHGAKIALSALADKLPHAAYEDYKEKIDKLNNSVDKFIQFFPKLKRQLNALEAQFPNNLTQPSSGLARLASAAGLLDREAGRAPRLDDTPPRPPLGPMWQPFRQANSGFGAPPMGPGFVQGGYPPGFGAPPMGPMFMWQLPPRAGAIPPQANPYAENDGSAGPVNPSSFYPHNP